MKNDSFLFQDGAGLIVPREKRDTADGMKTVRRREEEGKKGSLSCLSFCLLPLYFMENTVYCTHNSSNKAKAREKN